MVIHNKNFPSDLAEELKIVTREPSANRAVTYACRGYLILKSERDGMLSEISQLRAKLDCLIRGIKAKDAGERAFADAVNRVLDPQSFFLEQEER